MLKHPIHALLIAGLLMLFGAGCDAMSEEDTSGTFFLKGQVLNAETNGPVAGAIVRAAPRGRPPLKTAETDAEGRYDFAVRIDSTMELEVTATKDGITSDLRTALARAGEVKEMPDLRIAQIEEAEPEPGRPSNLKLIGLSSQSIMVKESGGLEVANLTFQAADSTGRPISLDTQTPVRFSLAQSPGGGEFIAPQEATTDNNGMVTVNLSSGTKAGVVQVMAEAEVDGRMIRSKPVSVTIHGGFPVRKNLIVRPSQYNIAGLERGHDDVPVGVVLGDHYNNPVKPGTAVYFTMDGGIIEGSALTDEKGRGSVDIVSAEPRPEQRGIVIVTASTVNESEQRIEKSAPVLFTGAPRVTIEPAVARLDETYTLTLMDANGNPMAPGTTIKVEAGGTRVKAVGNADVTLGDPGFEDQNGDGDAFDYEDVRRGPGITEFTFRAVEDYSIIEESNVPDLKTVTVTINGPNGDVEIVLTEEGTLSNITATEGARIEHRGEGAVVYAPAQ